MYVTWIPICKHCKFGDKIYYNSRDIELLSGAQEGRVRDRAGFSWLLDGGPAIGVGDGRGALPCPPPPHTHTQKNPAKIFFRQT